MQKKNLVGLIKYLVKGEYKSKDLNLNYENFVQIEIISG